MTCKYYKCIKSYRRGLNNSERVTFIEGINYPKEQVVNKVPIYLIPEHFDIITEGTTINKLNVIPNPALKQLFGNKSENKSNPCSLFNTLLNQIKDTHEKKNHDYGNSFAKSMDEFGMPAAAIRLSDKLNRFKSLIKSEAQVKDESIEDTLLDMAAYAIMTVEYLKKKKL